MTLEVEFQCGTILFCYHLFPSVRVNLERPVSVRQVPIKDPYVRTNTDKGQGLKQTKVS